MAYTMSLMNLGMLGLDQALLRFYREPPQGATGRSMFLACVRLSLLVMLVVGAGASVFFAPTLAVAFGLGQGGTALVPFLFLNAALYMLVRYVNVLLRLENDVRAYTVQTLWMNACLNLIYLLPGFFTSNTWAFIAAALAGFGGVAIAFWFRAVGSAQKSQPDTPARPGTAGRTYRLLLPYGILLAPAAILTPLYRSVCLSFLASGSGTTSQGLFEFAYTLAQLVTTVQAGFSTYWGPYVYANYRTEQARIGRIHDVLNFLVFGFFCLLILFEDIIFLIFPGKAACLRFFPGDDALLGVCHPHRGHRLRQRHRPPAPPRHHRRGAGRAGQCGHVRLAGAALTMSPAPRWRWLPPTRPCSSTAPSPDSTITAPSPASGGRSPVFCWHWRPPGSAWCSTSILSSSLCWWGPFCLSTAPSTGRSCKS